MYLHNKAQKYVYDLYHILYTREANPNVVNFHLNNNIFKIHKQNPIFSKTPTISHQKTRYVNEFIYNFEEHYLSMRIMQ